MSEQHSTGRARTRSRGRGRASSGQQAAQARRPGEAAPPARMPPPDPDPLPAPGRGRSRGGSSQVPGSGGPAEQRAPPTAQMAALSMSAAGEGGMGGISGRSQQMAVVPEPQMVKKIDKRGSYGNPVNLLTNCFKVTNNERWLLYQYFVVFEPEVVSPRARQGLLRFHTEALGNTMAFDGQELFLLKNLGPETVFQTKRRDTDAVITIRITMTNELPPDSSVCLQVYNIIFRKVLGYMGMQQIGRHYYNPNLPVTIPQHNMQLWPGFITSILEYDSGILLMADISHKILRTDTVLDFLGNLFASCGNRLHDVAQRQLIGQIVLTSYNNKTYRIDDIDWEHKPSDSFPRRDGSQMTYVTYYKEAYGREITDLGQPLLVNRPKQKDVKAGMPETIHLVPELCMLTGLSDEMRSNFTVMKDVAQHTRISPQSRLDTLTKFLKSLPRNAEASAYMKRWEMSFADMPLTVNARCMPPEAIYQKEKKLIYRPQEADWGKDMRGNLLSSSVSLNNWLLLSTKRDQPLAMDFFNTLGRVGGPMGINVQKPNIHQLRDDRSESYVNCIRENLTPETQLVVCILPNNRKDRYDAIKKQCCLASPVPSQCVVSRTLSKKQMLMSVCTKIAMQINVKLGGELWKVDIPFKQGMVIGIDTYHDSSSKGLSVGGFVASMNDSMTRFYSRCTFQHSGQELLDGLKVCLHAALKNYAQINGNLPSKVFIYRDGVGDGQLETVVKHELSQIKSTLDSFGQDYHPRSTMFIVKKRINNRFILQGHQLSNPPPGTVIDSGVTKPNTYDFFLVSQSVRQGTVTPTSYNVTWDSSGFKPDHLQRLTYKLTHLYYNWPGTIRVPAPCLYAHKLSFLVGQSLHQAPKLELADKLFFL